MPTLGEPNHTATRTRILIVDDEPEAIRGLQVWLTRHVADTALAGDIATAEQLLEQHAVDIVLCDVHMPGNQHLAWVKKILGLANPPALFIITGQPELEITLSAANLPITGFLIKPPDYTHLAQRLQQTLTQRDERRKLQHELQHVVTALSTQDDPPLRALHAHLQDIVRQLEDGGLHPRGTVTVAPELDWTSIVRNAVGVLEQTKSNFRSKEIAELRQRLESLLPEQP